MGVLASAGRPVRSVLTVLKTTVYQTYLQLSERGEPLPGDLRWDRLRERHELHERTVEEIHEFIRKESPSTHIRTVRRGELTDKHVHETDLVVSIGGDGTALQTSHAVGGDVPLLGICSDPTPAQEQKRANHAEQDVRRSTGALCAVTRENYQEYLAGVLTGKLRPSERTRIMVTVKPAGAAISEMQRLPWALNDILVAHPSPAAVSRYRMGLWEGREHIRDHGEAATSQERLVRENVRSSGLRVCTATGSTAAMRSAGGLPMPFDTPETPGCNRILQYMVREPIDVQHGVLMRGILDPDRSLRLRWNSLDGAIFVDGSNITYRIRMGDRIWISAAAPSLWLYPREPWYLIGH
mmetsp:Transcript_7587/g.46689  ORF Transcript_7587/g.46689 Transcript_7587/m.46689 type:complete len:353 (-) Transcript_7587:6391-7449(-)